MARKNAVDRLIARAATPKPYSNSGGRRSASQGAAYASKQNTDEDTESALDMARDGDDSALLPVNPMSTSNPLRPRTLQGGYDRQSRTLRVRFRDGTPWEYYEVPPNVARNFFRVQSPGKAINRTLNNYPYGRGDF